MEPIESSFENICNEQPEYAEFYHIYFATKYILQRHYYPFIKDVLPFYTDHGIDHINRVLKKLYFLLEPHLLTNVERGSFTRSYISLDKTSKKLNAYEMYLLMCSVLWHDIGNLYGRINHEKNLKKIFDLTKEFLYDETSSEWIKKICMAHSGKNAIETNIEVETKNEGDFTFYPRFLSALLRLCDELDEDKKRVGIRIYGQIPEEKRAHWFFCKCNDSIKIEKEEFERYKIAIEGRMDKAEIFSKLKKETDAGVIEVVGIEEYVRRVDKLNNERIYCGNHLKPHYFKPVDKIELRLRIYDGEKYLSELQHTFDNQNGYDAFLNNKKDELDKLIR